ncbi:uncharacterized protein [Macrobrachium rosenbergii]|uniref:uncharacterized protein n=1 Tax=Macrobrachium rosenbergii TaxID=79674 RepID=UPI0034D65751
MDQKPLVHAFMKAGDALSARQQRHLAAISEFGCPIVYVLSRKNPVALSWVEISSLHHGIDYKDLVREQAADPEMAAYRTALTALKWEGVPLGGSDTTLLCDTSTGCPWSLVPGPRLKEEEDIQHHSQPLPSIRAYNGSPDDRNVHVARRQEGRPPVVVGCQVPPDLEATPMEEASTASCAEALLFSWISRFGVPDSITIDRGSAFLSELWVSPARLMGTTLHSTMVYNPAANVMVERAHRSLKAALMAYCTNENWKAQLPWVLLCLLTAPRADGNVSPAEKLRRNTSCSRGILPAVS